MASFTLTRPRDVRNAWLLWGVLFCVVALIIASGSQRTVVPSYRGASLHWLAGEPLYDGQGTGFIYLPQTAVLFIPFSLLSPTGGEVVWRLLTIGLYAAGVWRLAQLAQRESGVTLFPLVTLIALPLAWSSARNGQATLAMAGTMLFATADLADSRWWRATLWLCLGLAIKPLIIVLMLLAGALFRPLALRMLPAIAVVAAFPFLAQRPDYVASQFAACLEMLRDASELGNSTYWAQLFGMLKVAGWEVPGALQTATRALFALLTLLVCILYLPRTSRVRCALYLYTLAACYLMLFNPRTENNTYSLLAPAIAVFASQLLLVERRRVEFGLLAAMAIGILGSYEFGRLVTSPRHSIWLAPLMGVGFSVYVVWRLVARDAAGGEGLLEPARQQETQRVAA